MFLPRLWFHSLLLFVVLWGVLSFAPSWFTAAVHLCVCWVFTYSCFYMFILGGGGGNKLFDWTHSSCNPLNDQQMETWLHLQARGFDHVITALGDRMSKSGWIPSLLVIQSWHSFCASLTCFCEAVQPRNILTEHLQFLYSRSRQPITTYLGANGVNLHSLLWVAQEGFDRHTLM